MNGNGPATWLKPITKGKVTSDERSADLLSQQSCLSRDRQALACNRKVATQDRNAPVQRAFRVGSEVGKPNRLPRADGRALQLDPTRSAAVLTGERLAPTRKGRGSRNRADP